MHPNAYKSTIDDTEIDITLDRLKQLIEAKRLNLRHCKALEEMMQQVHDISNQEACFASSLSRSDNLHRTTSTCLDAGFSFPISLTILPLKKPTRASMQTAAEKVCTAMNNIPATQPVTEAREFLACNPASIHHYDEDGSFKIPTNQANSVATETEDYRALSETNFIIKAEIALAEQRDEMNKTAREDFAEYRRMNAAEPSCILL